MSIVVLESEVMPGVPAASVPRAHIGVAVSLNFPDMTEEVAALVRRFTRVALTTLSELGASFTLLDTSLDAGRLDRLAGCDGLLLLGGGDIDPSCYTAAAGGASAGAVPNSYGIDLRADRQALTMIAAAESSERPILGICRGSQLINVHRGGTIVPDIDDPKHIHHGGPGQPMFLDERVALIAGTRLRSILEADQVLARAGHHQAVDVVGEGLVVCARAFDGITEGVEDPDRWILGVQWHPEDDDGPAEDRHRLFEAFIDACRDAALAASRHAHND